MWGLLIFRVGDLRVLYRAWNQRFLWSHLSFTNFNMYLNWYFRGKERKTTKNIHEVVQRLHWKNFSKKMPQHQFLTVTILWRQMRLLPHRQMPKLEFDTSHQPKHLYFYPDFQLNRKSWTPLPRMTKKSNKLRPNHQGALCQSILKDNLAISGLW